MFRTILLIGASLLGLLPHASAAVFPLKTSENGRFLIDQKGESFLVVGDTAWSLIAQLSDADIDRYLEDRQNRGFNSIIVNLIEHKFSTNPPKNPAVVAFGEQEWFTVNSVYSYEKTLFGPVEMEYQRRPIRPFVLIESTYEGEHNSTPDQIRRQAYWAILGGACGQFFGNNPMWHFGGPGLYPVETTWKEALGGTGSRDMARLRNLFIGLPWYHLEPEKNHEIVTEGYGEEIATALNNLKNAGFDVFTGYNYNLTWMDGAGARPFQTLIDGNAKIFDQMAEQSPLPYIPVVMAGWDRRPWEQDKLPPEKLSGWYPDRSPQQVERFVSLGVRWLDEHPDKDTDERLLLIYAWNEMGEGGYLTPTAKDGTKYLEAVQQAISIEK